MADINPSAVHFGSSAPILRVKHMETSLRFYVDLLGFQNASWGNEHFTRVRRDGAGIYLCLEDQGLGGAWVWIGVSDVERLHKDYKIRGVAIRRAPTNYPWALEMHLEDPDGNVLRMGSDSKDDRPFETFV